MSSAPRPLPDSPCLPASFWWFAAATVVIPTVILVFTITFSETLHLGSWIWLVHSSLIGAMILGLRFRYRRDLAAMRALLGEHGRMLCPRCHYPVDAAAGRCPECGTEVDAERIRSLWTEWEREYAERPTPGT